MFKLFEHKHVTQLLSLVLVTILLFTSVILPVTPAQARITSIKSTSTAASKFKDVSENHWAYSEIGVAVEAGYINGTSASTFEPNKTVTDVELIAMLGRILADRKIESNGGPDYWPSNMHKYNYDSDSPWWFEDVQFFYDDFGNIMSKFPDLTISSCNRETAALYCYVVLMYFGLNTPYKDNVTYYYNKIPDMNLVSSCDDKAIKDDYRRAVVSCVDSGVMVSVNSSNDFAPRKTLTRAEAVTLVNRLLRKIANKEPGVYKDVKLGNDVQLEGDYIVNGNGFYHPYSGDYSLNQDEIYMQSNTSQGTVSFDVTAGFGTSLDIIVEEVYRPLNGYPKVYHHITHLESGETKYISEPIGDSGVVRFGKLPSDYESNPLYEMIDGNYEYWVSNFKFMKF